MVHRGVHHLPRADNWPVMSTDWKTIYIMPHNCLPRTPRSRSARGGECRERTTMVGVGGSANR